MIKEIKNALRELGFSVNEIAVYIAVSQLGEATAAEIAKKSDLPRTTAISLLNKLREGNYLTTHLYRGKTYYWIESPKTISSAFQQKVRIADSLSGYLGDLYRSEAHFPSAQVFDTKTGIKNFIEKFLVNLEKNSVLRTIDSPKAENYTKVYLESMQKILLMQKSKKGILTQTLIPHGSFGSIEASKLGEQAIKIREMPEGINFETSIWLTKGSMVHFSGKPLFIIAVKHEAICQSVRSIYDFLWNISTPKN